MGCRGVNSMMLCLMPGILVASAGVGLFALPAGILAAGLIDLMEEEKSQRQQQPQRESLEPPQQQDQLPSSAHQEHAPPNLPQTVVVSSAPTACSRRSMWHILHPPEDQVPETVL